MRLCGILESGFDSPLLHARASVFMHISENRVYFRGYLYGIIDIIQYLAQERRKGVDPSLIDAVRLPQHVQEGVS